jgi:predicted MPP superfamily phosphohydrolase
MWAAVGIREPRSSRRLRVHTVQTLILRFSDFEAPTIGEHLRVLRDRGSVWWGWWKKDHEPARNELLAQYEALAPKPDLGLVDRTAGTFHVATCLEVRVHDGNRFPTPDPERTPAYYRDEPCPAWFLLSDLRTLSEEEFLNIFGEIPDADPSLFWVEQGAAGLKVFPRLPPPGEVTQTQWRSILHLSDCHFGDFFGFPLEAPRHGFEQSRLIDRVLEGIDAAGTQIGTVIVSGDLTTRGDANALDRDAIPFLENLLERLHLDKTQILIVPGNHDIYLVPGERTPTREYLHEKPFRGFLRNFYGADIQEIEFHKLLHTDDGDWHFSIVGFNSIQLRDQESLEYEYGFVGHRSKRWLDRLVKTNEGRDKRRLFEEHVLNIAVLHHHLVPVEPVSVPTKERPISVTLDAGRLIAELQESAIHVVLHGHQHLPFVGTVGRARTSAAGLWLGYDEPITVLGAGSAGAAVAWLPNELRENTYGIYTPDHDRLHVRIDRFNPSVAPRSYLEVDLRVA